MSIINDALKKAQSELLKPSAPPAGEEKKTPQTAPVSPPPDSPVRRQAQPVSPRPSPRWKMPRLTFSQDKLLLIVIGLCVCLLAGMIATLSAISTNGASRHKRNTAIVINGVMQKDGKTVALINNEVYEVGETINRMKIVAIALDRIDFLYKGRIRSFKVHRRLE